MTAGKILKEILEHPERREELLRSIIGVVTLVTSYGNKEVGEGFDDMLSTCQEFYGEHVTKEKLLDTIQSFLERTDPDNEAIFKAIVFDYTPIESIRLELKDFKVPEMIEVIDMDEERLPPPQYRPKIKSYDKRRNFKQKNFWNRIRSRCF